MLSSATKKLVEEFGAYFDERDRRVFGYITDKDRRKAEEDPEAVLVALLLVIKEDLPDVSAMLDHVETAFYDDNLKAAKEILGRATEVLQSK